MMERRKKTNKAPTPYEPIEESIYLFKNESKLSKESRHMVCDCILTKEERIRGVMGCLDDCLNRILMIECSPKCQLGDHCLNKRFQKNQSAKVEVFKTKKKGFGLRACEELPPGSFIMEYVGEIIRYKELRSRIKMYTKKKIKHHYFMALRSDEIIDATCKGNVTRFINHSCEPNCETQKWTVNGQLRIGFFTIRTVQAGEEITFDYKFQRFGRKAQKCYCETPSCSGFIGGEQTISINGHSSPEANDKKDRTLLDITDITLEDKINRLSEEAAEGLKTKEQVITLAGLSIKAEKAEDKKRFLEIIKKTKCQLSLKLFLDYHGLEIISLWMRDHQASSEFKVLILETLEQLPYANRTKITESAVNRLVERWANDEKEEQPVKALASRLLKKFESLSPGFKIPRLYRLQRQEIEKKMEEEEGDDARDKQVQVNNNPLLRLRKPPEPIKRKIETVPSSNNVDLTPTPPKISREEYRQQFELHVRLKEYYDNVERLYSSAVVEQIKMIQQTYYLLNGYDPPIPPPVYQRPAVDQPSKPNVLVGKPNPTNCPTTITLANHCIEPAVAINDDLAFSLCDYDEYYTLRNKPISVADIVESRETYPYPGSYYTTPDGETWFVTVTVDRATQQPRTVVKKICYPIKDLRTRENKKERSQKRKHSNSLTKRELSK